MNHTTPATLPLLISAIAGRFPDHGIGFVRPDQSVHFFTFPEMIQRARAMLAGMQDRGISSSDMVILTLEKSEEIIPVLWGCFMGGIIPALLQPPVTFTEYNPAAEKTEKVFRHLGKPFVILSHEHYGNWKSSRIPEEFLIDVAELPGNPEEAILADLSAEDLALIQFSSGSTGDPKGVMLSHRNLITNTADIMHGIRLVSDDITVNWMPLYHDMGLIGFHITPLSAGVTQYFLDPVDFVKNPSLWIDTMSRKKCTITACPNFGQMLVNRFLGRKTLRDWDLSPVRILFNGAEPISVETMRAFLAELAPMRLSPAAMLPAYGLAEATLAVTFPEIHHEPEVRRFRRNDLIGMGRAVEADTGEDNVIELVNLGKTLLHCELMITDDHNRHLGEDLVGHVLVKGGGITRGYFGREDLNGSVFHEGWLRTGDLGFLHEGNLYITGRMKDIIFMNGMNFYAHDLETVALQLGELTRGKIVITGFFDEAEGHDRLLVFLAGVTNEATPGLCQRIRSHFAAVIGLSADTFIPVRSVDIPRTSSGKLQRYKLAERYIKGEFERVIRL